MDAGLRQKMVDVGESAAERLAPERDDDTGIW